MESTSLFVLAILVVGFELLPFRHGMGEIRPSDFFSGFGHEALIAVCALMIAGQALVRTGALETVARKLSRFWKKAVERKYAIRTIASPIMQRYVPR